MNLKRGKGSTGAAKNNSRHINQSRCNNSNETRKRKAHNENMEVNGRRERGVIQGIKVELNEHKKIVQIYVKGQIRKVYIWRGP